MEGERIKGAMIRAGININTNLDKATPFFYQLEKMRGNACQITEIKNDNGKTKTNRDEILKEIENFYKKLYTKTETNKVLQYQIFKKVLRKRNIRH